MRETWHQVQRTARSLLSPYSHRKPPVRVEAAPHVETSTETLPSAAPLLHLETPLDQILAEAREKEPIRKDAVRIHTLQVKSTEELKASLVPDIATITQSVTIADNKRHDLARKHQHKTRPNRVAAVLFDELLSPQQLSFSSVIWGIKSAGANNPGQIVPAGHIMLENEAQGRPETVEETAARTLAQQMHLYGIVAPSAETPQPQHQFITQIDTRLNTFLHRKAEGGARLAEYTENWVTAEAAPFLIPRYFSPGDKRSQSMHLSPDDFNTLMVTGHYTDNQGKTWAVLDSLDPNSPTRHHFGIETDWEKTQQIKDVMVWQSYLFEAQARLDVGAQLLDVSTRNDLEDTFPHGKIVPGYKSKWKYICHHITDEFPPRSNHFRLKDDLSLQDIQEFISETNRFFTEYEEHYPVPKTDETDKILAEAYTPEQISIFDTYNIPRRKIAQRAAFADELTRAQQRVILERSLPFIQNCGPQKPFMAAQIVGRFDKLSPFKFERLKNIPELARIYEIPAQAFLLWKAAEILDPPETRKPGWYEKWYKQKIDILMKDAQELYPSWENDWYTEKDWYDNLTQRLKRYRQLWQKWFNDPQGNNDEYHFIKGCMEALFVRSLGIKTDDPERVITDLSSESDDFYNYLRPPTNTEILTPKLQALLVPNDFHFRSHQIDQLILRSFGLHQRRNEDLPVDEKIEAMIKLLDLQASNQVDVLYDNNKGRMGGEFDYVFETMVVPTDTFKQFEGDPAYFHHFQLNLPINSSYQYAGTNIDFNQFPAYIYAKKHKKEKESVHRKYLSQYGTDPQYHIYDFFGQMVILDTTSFLHNFEQRYGTVLDEFAKADLIRNWSRTVASAIIQHHRDRFGDTAEPPNWRLHFRRDRQWGVFDSLLEENGIETTHRRYMAGATRRRWDNWLKFVLEANRHERKITQENQFLLDFDAHKKLTDDARYFSERLWEVDEPGYFPLILVMFGEQKEYEEAVQQAKQQIVIYKS